MLVRKFDQISIENKVAVPGTTFPPLLVYGKIFHCSRASNSKENDPTWPKFELVRDFMPLLDTCKFEGVALKLKALPPGHFPHYKSMGPIYCHGNHSFEQTCSKSICSQSPTQTILHMKFDQDWPAGSGDIHV